VSNAGLQSADDQSTRELLTEWLQAVRARGSRRQKVDFRQRWTTRAEKTREKEEVSVAASLFAVDHDESRANGWKIEKIPSEFRLQPVGKPIQRQAIYAHQGRARTRNSQV